VTERDRAALLLTIGERLRLNIWRLVAPEAAERWLDELVARLRIGGWLDERERRRTVEARKLRERRPAPAHEHDAKYAALLERNAKLQRERDARTVFPEWGKVSVGTRGGTRWVTGAALAQLRADRAEQARRAETVHRDWKDQSGPFWQRRLW